MNTAAGRLLAPNQAAQVAHLRCRHVPAPTGVSASSIDPVALSGLNQRGTLCTMLTQAEADALIAMSKRLEQSIRLDFPSPGDKASWQATSLDGRERFLFDVNRGRFRLIKCTYQERYRMTEILVRVDLGGPPHRNPDGVVVGCPHIHV